MDKKKVRSIKEMTLLLEKDQRIMSQMKSDPVWTLRNRFEIPDPRVYRYVVFFLGLTILSIVIGYFAMTLYSKNELEPAIIALASGAVGALAGMLRRP